MSEIRFFSADQGEVYVTEFGYSEPQHPKTVGPWVRGTYILHYVLDGVCQFDGLPVKAGEAFLIAKDVLHRFSVEPAYRHFWLAFDGRGVSDLLSRHGIRLHSHTVFSVRAVPFVNAMLKEAFAAAATEKQAATAALHALLPLLEIRKNLQKSLPHNAVRDAAAFIQLHYSSAITMEQVAASVFLSEKYLCKRFSEAYGVPPQTYLMQVRMRRAQQLLRETELQIREIAKSVGYTSVSVFSAAFKKAVGEPPDSYRSQMRNTENTSE